MTQEIVLKDPTSLHEHPRNQEFFDDIAGSKWDEFKTSIAQMGVMNPLIVTEDKNEKRYGKVLIIHKCATLIPRGMIYLHSKQSAFVWRTIVQHVNLPCSLS